MRRALADLDAIAVDLDGATGFVLPDDVDAAEPVEPSAALLPPLDPTTMGWFERAWYLGAHKTQLFDTTGNAGPTVWWDGRIVGGWRQDDAGEVVLQLLEDVGSEGRGALEHEAARLTEWLGGVRVLPAVPVAAVEGVVARDATRRHHDSGLRPSATLPVNCVCLARGSGWNRTAVDVTQEAFDVGAP